MRFLQCWKIFFRNTHVAQNDVKALFYRFRSSANDNSNRIQKFIKTPERLDFPGFFLCLKLYKKWVDFEIRLSQSHWL